MHPVIYELITESNDSLLRGRCRSNRVQQSGAGELFGDYLPTLFSIILIVVMFVFMINIFRSQNNQGDELRQNTARVQQSVKTRFSDIAGAEEEKEELVEIIDFLKNPANIPNWCENSRRRAALFTSGNQAKPCLPKRWREKRAFRFFSISGSDFVEMFVGVGAKQGAFPFSSRQRKTCRA